MEYAVFTLKTPPDWREIFVAELAELGFEMMEETDDGISAVVEESRRSEMNVDAILAKYSHIEGLSGEWQKLQAVNWNEEWENNYEPVSVEDKCLIRADFHSPEGNYLHEIVINPRMSFGTGHHATTWLMVRAMFELDFTNKSVLDAGCGTGILAILAEKLGADRVHAYDISELCSQNTLENAEKNNCSKIDVETATITELQGTESYDFILANINRNALLEEIPHYRDKLKSGGELYLSGFFKQNEPELVGKAESCDMSKIYSNHKDGWSVLGFSRS